MEKTNQPKTIDEQIVCYLSELITLQLAFAIHRTNRSVRECIKGRIPQLS